MELNHSRYIFPKGIECSDLFLAFLKAPSAAMCLLDDNFKLLFFEGGGVDFLPQEIRDLPGKSVIGISGLFSEVFEDIEVVKYGTTIRHDLKLGNFFWNISLSPILSRDKIFSGVVCVFLRQETAIPGNENSTVSEQIFRRISEWAPQLVMAFNEKSELIFCNQNWWNFLGIVPTEADLKAGVPWSRLVHPEEWASANARFIEIVTSGQGGEIIVRILRKDGVYRYHNFNVFPISRILPVSNGWVAVGTDIDDQKFIEKAFGVLAETSAAVLNAKDFHEGLDIVAKLAIPFISDYCAIDLFEDERLKPVVVRHFIPEREGAIIEFRKIWDVLGRKGLPDQIPLVPDKYQLFDSSNISAAIEAKVGPWLDKAREIGIRKVLRIPVRGKEHTIGVLTFGITETFRNFSKREIDFANTMAEQVGVALEKLRNIRKEQEGSARLLQLMTRLQTVQEEERQRVSRDIHDELGQNLTVLKMELALMKQGIPSEMNRLTTQIDSILGFVDRSIQGVRKIASELRPIALEDLGLAAALEWLLRDFENRTKIICRSFFGFHESELSQEVATVLYRVTQEALTNIAKHSGANRIKIGIFEESSFIHLEIHDYGVGLKDVVDRSEGLGIIGMQERARAVGGVLSVSNQPGLGAVVRLKVPIKGVSK